MKKIFITLLTMITVFTLVGCDSGKVDPPVEDSTEITVTSEAKNSLKVGDEVPDFTTWFEIDNSILGNVPVTEGMISTTLVSSNGLISQVGEYDVVITYTDANLVNHSEIVHVVVEEQDTVIEVTPFEVEHYMASELTFETMTTAQMSITYKDEGTYEVLVANVAQASNTDWHSLFGYFGLNFVAGNRYTFTITAKTEVQGGRDFGVAFERNDRSRMSHQTFTLTDEYQTFTGSMVADGDVNGGRFNIFLGNIPAGKEGKIIFKEIKIVESTEVIEEFDNPGEATWTAPDLTNMDAFVENLINTMTIEEKVGQMIQGERASVTPDDVKNYNLGSILNGGGSIPGDSITDWYNMYVLYQLGAESSSAGIPIIFGTDSVHGNNNLINSTIFPHNIGLGAANDPELMRRIGEVVAIETRLTGISWTFAPAVSIAQDARWGRTYESFSENTALVTGLTRAYIEGLQDNGLSATAKHYLADGGTVGGTDQGNVLLSEQEVRDLHLAPYYEAIAADVDTIMISYSSINGTKMHGSEYWIQTVLKDEMGFEGFIISDYEAIHQITGNHYNDIVISVNAGVDMLMEPHDWKDAYNLILQGYNNGDISLQRINDAVRRILTVKYKRGLFTDDIFRYQPELHAVDAHLEVAREAVRKSLVLLQNNNSSLPLTKDQSIAIIGPGADDFGLMFGGWTLGWQGANDPSTSTDAGWAMYRKEARATTIYDGFIDALIGETGSIVSDINQADTVIVVLAETPYAEYHGDDSSLDIINGRNAHPGNAAAIEQARIAQQQGKNVVGILLSGRPMLIEDILPHFDSFIAAWLPGSEGGNGIADVVFGDFDFTGTSPFVWYMDSSQFGTNSNTPGYDPLDYLFPYGFGLSYND